MMDALEEAGLDLELGEMSQRLDTLFSSRRPRAVQRHKAAAFEVSAVEAGPGRLRVMLDADQPDAVGRTILTLAIKHGSRPAREGGRKPAAVPPIDTFRKG